MRLLLQLCNCCSILAITAPQGGRFTTLKCCPLQLHQILLETVICLVLSYQLQRQIMEICRPEWSQYEIRFVFQPPREQLLKFQSSPKFFNRTDKSISTASIKKLSKGHVFAYIPAKLIQFSQLNYHIKFILPC